MIVSDPYARLTGLIAQHYWTPKKGFYPLTRICEDIGIDGIDGSELMKLIATEFSMNMEEFDSTRYFAPEGFNIIGLIVLPFRRFMSESIKDFFMINDYPTRPITLEHIVSCILQGRWIDPDDDQTASPSTPSRPNNSLLPTATSPTNSNHKLP